MKRLFPKKRLVVPIDFTNPKTFGERLAEATDGANLVQGKQTWQHVENKKHDITIMKECCSAEIKTMELANIVPAPYYFERVAILSRKAKNYKQEIEYCELYISVVGNFYKENNPDNIYDVREGPRYKAIVHRLGKAKELQKKHKS